MHLKLVLFAFFSLLSLTNPVDLSRVRTAYVEASGNESATIALNDDLVSVAKTDNKTLVAFKGAVTTMMAKYAKGIKEKKTFFKEGAELLEFAIAAEPDNVEIRCIRLSVQENVPKITGYTKNIEEDKQFIIENFNTIPNKNSKDFVKGYISKSEAFNESERQLLQGS
ncbi:hypothetical protein Q4603_15555 [Zobellia galactanivorans]|uniref:Conserved hypothetical periplasmic protein n=1 Tax=Zobellia galactanivorans (strain DSM 12802 / CCUG 47099 / CIP 106680 / NCIMB 13871 / Dsij) TaxID=63186 RepID=G0L5D9_ZOBGA|nr:MULTISPECIES: hypothetical protein [Zobellia]MBU3026427.1 hypothetical protein [Zobellia galactanivorans]MDO6810040.1 hypothetical protein [Zobellia galactanivorans]OWW27086.1 hypothetical protein B4Q04_05265 [Zobellia sp. OII3]CAZ96195.1 Conserved hypothetical periplasmic protein [Zobellia galactanivorans]